MFAQIWKYLRDPGARLALPRELKGRPHDGSDLVGEESGVLVEMGQFLVVPLFERGLVLPGIDVALSAVHEEPNHRSRPRGIMRRLRRHGMQSAVACTRRLLFEQSGEREQPKARAGALQKCAPRAVGTARVGE